LTEIKKEFLSFRAAKARSRFDEIKLKEGRHETFTASNGWFARFKKLLQIFCKKKNSGEAASADIETTCAFTAELKKIIEDNDVPPHLVFNVNETGLYGSKMKMRRFVEPKKCGRGTLLIFFPL
jgi:hypothetical protein